MGSISALSALQLPVRLRGIKLGRPVDLLVQAETWQALGFVVRCGDESLRFLPYAAAQLTGDDVAVGSPLILLEDVAFYESRGASLRGLLGRDVERGGRAAGTVHDLLLGPGGTVVELELERDGELHRVRAQGSTLLPTRATAA